MSGKKGTAAEIGIALLVLAAVLAFHFFWVTAISPEIDEAASEWAALPSDEGFSDWLRSYVESGGYFLGYSYGISFAFAVYAVRRYLKSKSSGSKGFAVAGVSFFGLIAGAGCFMIGCCGSPMLVVWLNLFGASFLPFAKPLLAALTTLSIILTLVWMERKKNPVVALELKTDKGET